MNRKLKIGGIYVHFKGNKYEVIDIAKDSETEEDVVIYKNINDDKLWVRSLEMFMSEVDHSKYPDVKQKYRFQLLTTIKKSNDKEFVDEMIKQLKENNGYCPCKLIKDETTKCICEEFRNQEEGTCHCGLYYKISVPTY